MSPEFHIVSNGSAAGSVKQALGSRCPPLLVNQDLLSCGPLPEFTSLDRWREIREQYVRSVYLDRPPFSFSEREDDLLVNVPHCAGVEAATLWVGTVLEEQLLLAWVVRLLKLVGADPLRLRVIQFTRVPGKPEQPVSIWVLNPDQLYDHPPAEPLTEEVVEALEEAWCAVTSPEPDALLRLIAAEPGPIPHLRRALKCFLDRFPDASMGVTLSERDLLRFTEPEGPSMARVMGHVLGERVEGFDWASDHYLFTRVRRLADPSLLRPALTLSGRKVSIGRTEVALTETGRDVLAGRANFVELNGIDDWVGGVHLQSAQNRVWFHRDDTLVRWEG